VNSLCITHGLSTEHGGFGDLFMAGSAHSYSDHTAYWTIQRIVLYRVFIVIHKKQPPLLILSILKINH
jgi:hypothetical protein